MFKALISDLDGIIVNSEEAHFLSVQKMLKEDFGIHYTEEDNRSFIGTTDVYIFTTLEKKYPKIHSNMKKLVNRRSQFFIEIFKKQAKQPLPCVKSLFETVYKEKIPMAVGTSAAREVAEFSLKTFNLLHYFKTVVTAGGVKHGKPAPDIYLKAAKHLNVKPKDCVVLEDSEHGVEAAKAAGMKCIAIPCGPTIGQNHEKADLVVKSLCNVTLDLLASL